MQPEIKISDYVYDLPDERISKYPLEQRDHSKLLLYNIGVDQKSDAPSISHTTFYNLPYYLPKDSLVVFNNTKVVPARLLFRRDTGATIEVFCLEPESPIDYQLNFASTHSCRWKAIIGNIKRWKSGKLHLLIDSSALNDTSEQENPHRADTELLMRLDLQAELIERYDNTAIVEFTWNGDDVPFSKVMEVCGRMPIPPYLKRDTQLIDYERYQTLYAKERGSVAAPTAGLHFTGRVLDDLDSRGFEREELCLHVGAGTFLPVKSEYISHHKMHTEPFSVTADFLRKLKAAVIAGRPVTAVGTTSTRCLESLYFLGVHIIENGHPTAVEQWEPYRDEGYDYTLVQSIDALLDYMAELDKDHLISRTGIIIVPGYKYRVIDYLVTNFHQPQSTLLLLISAFVGEENWRSIYNYALANGFRFLSYGDSSLLKRK